MTSHCKEWTRTADLFCPLCTNEMMPEEGLASCPVCVRPDPIKGVCGGLCDPALPVGRYIALNLGATLSDTPYGYPFLFENDLNDNFVNLYDKFTPGATVGAPCTLAATGWFNGVNTGCTWRHEVSTDRWIHIKLDVDGGYTTELDIVDAPYGTSISNPFSNCANILHSGGTHYSEKHYCTRQTWGYSWEFSINTAANTAQLRLRRSVSRHWTDTIGQPGVYNCDFTSGVPPGVDMKDKGPFVYNYSQPSYDFSTGLPFLIYSLGDIAVYTATGVCQSEGRLLMNKTTDVARDFNYASGRAICAPTGFPDQFVLNVS